MIDVHTLVEFDLVTNSFPIFVYKTHKSCRLLLVCSVTNNTESNYQQNHHHTLQILHPNCDYFHNLSSKFGENVPNCRNTNGKTMKKEQFVLPSLIKLMLLKCQVL